ncbi:caspase family protein [Actinoplanes sp. NPDC048796]|uniref:caspase family protein n=1 Tax=Actinoplanes sp. NPDC048796 TaxID=3155640 RepID=UPI00341104B6
MSDDSVLPDLGGSRAILVGVDAYQKLEALPSVRENLTRLASLFQDPSRWGLPASNCVEIRNPAASAAVYDALEEAAAEVTDTLVFYYAGHGLIDADATDDELYLALPDSRPDSAYRTGMPYSWIRREILKARKARRKVVILDCCYSGRALARMGSQTGDDAIRRLLDIDGTCVLTASARTRTALAPPDEDLTAFTGVLVEALTTGIPDGPELLDVETLYRYAWQRLLAKERPRPQKAETGLGGRIALSRNPAHRAFLVHEVARLTSERDAALARSARLKANLDDDQSELVKNLRTEITANQTDLSELRKELAAKQGFADQLEDHVDRLRSEAATLRESLESARSDARDLGRQADLRIAAMARDVRAAQDARAVAEREQRTAEADRTAARSALLQVTGELDRARAGEARTEALVKQLRAEILDSKRQVRTATTPDPPKPESGSVTPPTVHVGGRFAGLAAFFSRKGRRAVAWLLLLIFVFSNVMYVLIAWKGFLKP